ncbi:putative expressed protein [Lyophyllum shimeji]|uniref:Expressed protein n=1 Tax=Lyophyllum shimeji TaxID=47721 RepID=A0A9P3PL09_LYOSH|nr:putative expressed protein [Lyophyllum shimeji]
MGSTSSPDELDAAYDPHSIRNGKLFAAEVFWRDHYQFLKDHGYILRPRYHPDWVASWLGTSKDWTECEDGVAMSTGQVLDATRADGSLVILKRINTSRFPQEITVGRHLSSEPLASNPRNRCVPILDVIQPPEGAETAFVVMPFLFESEFVPFETVGEAVEFFRQLFQGLQFMHENNVVHGDCKYDNIMADLGGLFDSPPHPCWPRMKRDFTGRTPKPASRTTRPVKYYLVDFNLSQIYRPEDAPHVKTPPWGGDQTVPEFSIPGAPPCDPFRVDVYCLGNAIRENFLDGWENMVKPKQGFEFMRELISDMTNKDPLKRPTMDEVVSRFDDIIKRLSAKKLRSPVLKVGEIPGMFRFIVHWSKQTSYTARRLPPIPRA